MKTRNSKQLESFTAFCKANPSMRFWQALNSWAELPNLVVMDVEGKIARDTFYWEGKNK